MQKLFRVFLNSATYPFKNFAFVQENNAYYELVLLSLLQTENTIMYSIGGDKARIEKIDSFKNFPYAQKYLKPCIYNKGNCNTCGKCVRTMVALYALGELDKYSKVFDIDYFYKNIDWYIGYTIAHSRNEHYKESLNMMKKKNMLISKEAYRIGKVLSAAQKICDKNKNFIKSKMNI